MEGKHTRNHETGQQLVGLIQLLRTMEEASEAEQEVPCAATVVEQACLGQGTSVCNVCHCKATSQKLRQLLPLCDI